MDKKQVQEAIVRIDDILARGRFSEPILNRYDQVALVNSVQLVQKVCEAYFANIESAKEACKIIKLPEKKDDGTNEPTDDVEPGDKNIEGSGDSI